MAERTVESLAGSLKRELTDAASESSGAKRKFQDVRSPKEKDEGVGDTDVKVPGGTPSTQINIRSADKCRESWVAVSARRLLGVR